MTDGATVQKLNPDYRKSGAMWWDSALKEKRRRRRRAYRGIITPEKNSNKTPGSLPEDQGLKNSGGGFIIG